MKTKKALLWVIIWICCALLFNLGIYLKLGSQKALEFLGGYIIELSLSVDNLFLFLIIFQSFMIAPKYQHRVLTYGITGAVILRLVFIFMGAKAIDNFHFILPLFGIILIYSGIKIFTQDKSNENLKDSTIIKYLSKIVPITSSLHGQRFFVRINNVLHATPLFAVLILIEASDVVFAIDSIPAIFSITTDTFIVYTSNIFAILGLRSLYFLLEKVSHAFRFVKYGVAIVLVFIGSKLSIELIDVVMNYLGKRPLNLDISIGYSVVVIGLILSISIASSLAIKPKNIPS